jgi:hypothetical protein
MDRKSGITSVTGSSLYFRAVKKMPLAFIKMSSQYLLPAMTGRGRPPLREILKKWIRTLLGIVLFKQIIFVLAG